MDDLTLKDAADQFGVSVITLKRRQKAGDLPEAVLKDGDTGPVWVLPASELPQIAEREGWVIDLRGTSDTPLEVGESEGASLRYLIEQVTDRNAELAEAAARATTAERAAEIEANRARQAESDAEHERARANNLETELATAKGETERAEGRSEALTSERDELRSELATRATEIDQAHTERRELAALLEYERMGWWSRRRFVKNQANNG